MLTQASKIQACRFDYEYLGKSLEQLAKDYGYPVNLLANEIKEQSWTRKIDTQETSLPTVTDLAVAATTLKETTTARLNVIGIYRQLEQAPLIAQLEQMILEKALEIVNTIRAEDMYAPNKLHTLLQTARAIQQKDPISVSATGKTNQQNQTGGVVVQIQNNIQ